MKLNLLGFFFLKQDESNALFPAEKTVILVSSVFNSGGEVNHIDLVLWQSNWDIFLLPKLENYITILYHNFVLQEGIVTEKG